MMVGVMAAIPDDVLAGVLRRLPPQSLAVARSVCKPWRAIVDGHGMLLPHAVHGVFVNYVDHRRPHLFSRPASPGAVDGLLHFVPEQERWSVLDHCNGVLLCDMYRSGRLLVCNPATREWTLLPPCAAAYEGAAAYIVFDPAASPHYEVVLIPAVPEKPKPPEYPEIERRRALQAQQEKGDPFCLDWFFSSPADDGAPAAVADEEDGDEEFAELCFSWRTGRWEEPEHDDVCRLMEWPPTPWTLLVLSSKTGQWEERPCVRQGEPVGIVQDMRLDLYGPRRRYAVYSAGVLYVHCRVSFVMRLSLSDDKYQVIKAPANIEHTKPYLGRLGNRVCFGITDHECKLSVWILNEWCGQMEWVLKHEENLMGIAQHIGSYGEMMNGAWILRESKTSDENHSSEATKTAPSSEWDTDNDDIIEVNHDADYYVTHFNILGFHPYKEVIYLVEYFGVVAYHLNTLNVQYLGNARPDCYYRSHWNDIYESFVYTPCMIGGLDHQDSYED